MSNPFTEPRKFDVRTIERNIKQGTLTRKEVKDYLDSLPDAANKSTTLGEMEGREGAWTPTEE